MNRMSSAIPSGAPQPPLHMQPVHSGTVISGPLNLPNPLASGMAHSAHGVPLSGSHEREHIISASGSGPIPGHYFSALGINPGSHSVPNMLPHGHHQFHHTHPVLSLTRLPHLIGQPELRIFEMNKRLQHRSDDCDSQWWESFATDFFEDDATLTLAFLTEDGPKRYTIGRTLIPRYFRSIFESGCGELYYNLRLNHEYFHHPSLTLDSESATMTMNMVRSIPATVVLEGRLTLDFAFDDLMRIRAWIFMIRSHREMIMRSMLGIQDPAFLDQLSKNVTRYGMTSATLNFFRLSVILEPMQELMSRQKAYSLTPRDCLKTTLFQKWQRTLPQESSRQPSKRRKRKGSAATTEGTNNVGRVSKRKQSPIPIPTHHIPQPGDVMIVGEPTLMGGDFGDEDERLITRLENTQYDAAAAAASGPLGSHMLATSFPGSSGSPAGIISSPLGLGPSGSNMAMNSGQHTVAAIQFRGPLSYGNQHMHMNESNFPISFGLAPHPHSVSIPSGQPVYSGPFPNRNMHHPLSIPTQQFMQIPPKGSVSALGNSREHYMAAIASGTTDAVQQPARSHSASSLLDNTNGFSGFPHCASPSLLPSRPPARFTPPSLPNGIGQLQSQQSNFIMHTEMIGGGTQMGHVSIPGTPLTSPLTSSAFTLDSVDNAGMLHSVPSTLASGVIKTCNSPIIYGSMTPGSTNHLTPDSNLLSTMSGMGCELNSTTVLNEVDESKLSNPNSSGNNIPSRPVTESV